MTLASMLETGLLRHGLERFFYKQGKPSEVLFLLVVPTKVISQMRLFLKTLTIVFAVLQTAHAQKPLIFTDPRDNQDYEIVKLKIDKEGSKQERVWFADNLNYATENSTCFKGYEVFCENHGRLYNWNEAKTACPQGWHISTFKDWYEMLKLFGGLKKAGKLIQKNQMKIEMSGFGEPNGEYYDVGIAAYFWDDEPRIIGTAGHINVLSDSEMILHQRVFSYHKNSVRCVKDY